MYGGGLGILDVNDGKIRYFNEASGLPDNNVLSLAFDGEQMWIATLNGVVAAKYSESGISFHEVNELNHFSRFIYCVYKDARGRIWMGTDGKGAAYYMLGKLTVVPCSKSIIDITEDSDGNIWLLNHQNEVEIFPADGKLRARQGIHISGNKLRIIALQKSSSKNIIALTSNGIAELNATSFLQSHLPSSIVVKANYLNISDIDRSGDLWFALENALIRYSPEKKYPRTSPKILFEQLLIDLVETDTSVHWFSHDENHFTFKFSGLWFKQQESVSFMYRLEGLKTEADSGHFRWIPTRDNTVTFPNLPPGSYIFHLKATVNGNVDDNKILTYRFSISKPFWETWWFMVSLIILLSFLLYFFITHSIKKREKRALLEKQRLQVQLDTLTNQINPHFLFNSFNTLIATIHSDAESAVEYVEHLSDYYRRILQRQNKEVITLEEELELASEYFFLQKKRFGENLVTEIDISENLTRSLIPPMTLQLLAENAVKHNIISKANPLKIRIFSTKDFIIVSNNRNIREEKAEGLGIGLNNIKYRYQLLFRKEAEIIRTDDSFEVHLPVIHETEPIR